MGTEEMLSDLIDLVRKESAVISLYDRALEVISTLQIKENLLIFQQDHKRHLQILLEIINNADILPPVIIGESNSEYQQYYQRISEKSEVLENLIMKEKDINLLYEKSLSWEVDSKTAEIFDDNLEDEQQHIKFLNKVMNDLRKP